MKHFAPVLLLAALLAPGDEARIEVPHEHYVLDNGLHVVLASDTSLPRVEVNLWYQVGSKDEPVGRSGFAHLFEHLMFMGTERVPNARFDEIMEAGGGANNATTSQDRTNYFDWGPAPLLETLLYLESDRLESLDEAMTLEKLRLQREVVRNERRQSGENRPYGSAGLLVSELMYPPGHPYHISVIGTHEDLQAATVDDVVDFFQRYYVPNNASLTVVGDFLPEHARRLIADYFGDLPPGPEPPVVRVEPVLLDGERRITLTDRVQLPRVSFVWHSPPFMTPGDGEMDLIADGLAGGRSSRLYQRLVVEDASAVNVVAYQASQKLGSLFQVQVYATPGADLGAIEAAVDEEIARYVKAGPLAEELQRTVAGIETSTVAGLQSLHARADALNRYLMYYGTPDGFERDLDRYRRADPEGVRRWAASVLRTDRRLVMTVLPEGAGKSGSARDSQPSSADAPPGFEPPVPTSWDRDSGLSVWHLNRPGLPLVDLTLVLPGGSLSVGGESAGLASIAASMMQEGAGELDALAFTDALEQLGASFDVSAGSHETFVSMSVLKRHVDAALELFHDAIVRPRFDGADFERVRRLHVEGLRQALDDPNTVARQVSSSAWFGEEHPYGRPGGGYPETVEALSAEAARDFHARLARPEGALLVLAGDLDAEEARAIATRLDSGWPAQGIPLLAEDTPEPGRRPARVLLVDRPGAPQTVLRFVMPGQAGRDPARIPADVFNTLLGGSFTSRLNQNLREEKGYTYGARSGFTRLRDQGLFVASSSVRTDVTGASLTEFFAEFERVRGGDIDEAEAVGAATGVRSRLVAGYESLGSTVGTWIAMRERGSTPEDAARDVAALGDVTAGQLNEMAAGLVPLDHYLLVMVGDAEAVLPQLDGLGLPTVERVDERGRPVEGGP